MTDRVDARGTAGDGDAASSFPIAGGPAMFVTIGHVKEVDGVWFDLSAGETLALVGKSGCGKSTTGRMLLRLTEPTSGSIRFGGEDLLALGHRALRRRRREMQMVFQDPYSSLSPRQVVEDIISEPLDVYRLCATRGERSERVIELLHHLRLDAFRRRPFPFDSLAASGSVLRLRAPWRRGHG